MTLMKRLKQRGVALVLEKRQKKGYGALLLVVIVMGFGILKQPFGHWYLDEICDFLYRCVILHSMMWRFDERRTVCAFLVARPLLNGTEETATEAGVKLRKLLKFELSERESPPIGNIEVPVLVLVIP
jgi:hypothetical protein